MTRKNKRDKSRKGGAGLAPPPQKREKEEDGMEEEAGEDATKRSRAAGGQAGRAGGGGENKDNLQFEDPFEDEFEEEEVVVQEEEDEDDMMEVEEGAAMEEDEKELQHEKKKVWRPGVDQLKEGEALEFDPSAYVMYHCLTPEWPCLSFDIMKDQLGGGRTRFPVTMYAVCGTQADRATANKLTVMKLSDMLQTHKPDDSDSEEEEEDEDEEAEVDPLLEQKSIDHRGGVNRLRCMPQKSNIVASWADTADVYVWDLAPLVHALDHPTNDAAASAVGGVKPLMGYGGHRWEGFAMDWSAVQEGRLATGDNDGLINIWQGGEGGKWNVEKGGYKGHQGSVEDLQWSPTEASVFISCSSDQTVRVWDVRNKQGSMLSIKAHDADVNVCSWNRNVAYLVVTGSDDGSFKVWDLRHSFAKGEPIAHFTWHKGPITSVEWHPLDESILACASEDDTVTIWDLSVEEDEGELPSRAEGEDLTHLPPQLLFVHQGQKHIKELHFHAQVPGLIMTTAMDGFNVFKPAIGV